MNMPKRCEAGLMPPTDAKPPTVMSRWSPMTGSPIPSGASASSISALMAPPWTVAVRSSSSTSRISSIPCMSITAPPGLSTRSLLEWPLLRIRSSWPSFLHSLTASATSSVLRGR